MNHQIVRLKEAAKKLGVSPATMWRRLKNDETFPRLVRIGPAPRSAIGFYQHELEEYLSKSTQQREIKKNKGADK
ncbi:helix-turn-helix transcriptional regulator [Undibacterium sp. Ji22W]|uniref:helix-turn-helix transcriptional regulator n=1 Tax=Undibacterium sp. Ji22W TaxID=3413038 RepID=UPI003BF3DB2F